MGNLFDLTGKVAVITGASSGLGADAARAYAGQGADIALLARRKDRLEALAADIKEMGVDAIAVECDVSSEDSVIRAADTVLTHYGRADILLNNAGVAVRGAVEDLSAEEWDRGMDVNVRGVYLVCKYFVPGMRQRKYGRIVNIASVNAFVADKSPDLARHVYNASKSAVVGLTKGMAASYAIDNVTVNCIGPGLFESEMTEGTLFKHEGFMSMYNALTPAGRPGRRGELNGTILYFSSDASSYVTGQAIIVDGGFSIV